MIADDVFFGVMFFVLGLIMMTVLGHGVWVVVAALIRAVLGISPAPHQAGDCPVCGASNQVVAGVCGRCGANRGSPPETQRAARDESLIVVRRLRELYATGAISQAEFEKLARLVDPRTATGPAVRDDVEIVEAEVIEEPAGVSPFDESHVPPRREPVPGALTPVPAVPPPHPLDRDEPRADVPPASTPRRTLAALLQAFMEEKNIRWGEIISGLLIIVCAVGLVVSLWATLRDSIPYLPALIFLVGTAAFHAVGHYTLRRWDLSSISRAILIIGTLLIPLNFLAAIALSGNRDEQPAVTSLSYLASIGIGLLAYGAMTYFAGRVFLRSAWWRLPAGVMGPAAGQLVINRMAVEGLTGVSLLGLVGLPLIGFLIATLSGMHAARRWKRLSLRRAEPMLLVLGTAMFSLLCSLALVVVRLDSLWRTLASLTPALSLAIGVMLATGLLIHQRTTSARLYALRVSGTSLAIIAAMGLVVCILLAWPDPLLLVTVATLNAILLAVLGFFVRLSLLHGFAVLCGGFSWVIAWQLWVGDIAPDSRGGELLRAFLTGRAAAILGAWSLVVSGVGAGLGRMGRSGDARAYLAGAAGTIGVSGLVATVVGFAGLPTSEFAPLTLLGIAVLLVAGAWFKSDGRVAWCGSAALLVASLQALGFVDPSQRLLASCGIPTDQPFLFALLFHGAVGLAIAAGVGRLAAWRSGGLAACRGWSSLVCPLSESALVATLAASPLALWIADFRFARQAGCCAAIALVWCGVAVVRRWPRAWMVGQAQATIAIGFAVAAWYGVDTWSGLLQPQFIASVLAAFSAWCVLAVGVRWGARRRPAVAELLDDRLLPTVDRMTIGLMLGTLHAILILACVSGVVGELGWQRPGGAWLPDHQQAFGYGMWGAWAAITGAVIVALHERPTPRCVERLVLVSAAVPWLYAGPHEADAATLSALRWSLATWGLTIAHGWFFRDKITTVVPWLGGGDRWEGPVDSGRPAPRVPLLIVTIAVMAVVLATTATVLQVVRGSLLGGPHVESFYARIGPAWSYGVPLAFTALSMLVVAVRDSRPAFAIGGSLVLQYLASLACLLPPLTAGLPLTEMDLVRLGQWNALALGGYGLVWIALRDWIEPADNDGRPPATSPDPWSRLQPWFGIRGQLVAAVTMVAGLATAAAIGVVSYPGQVEPVVQRFGHWSSFVALSLVVAGTVGLGRGRLGPSVSHVVAGAGVCLTAFMAAVATVENAPTDWVAFHVLLTGWSVVVAAAVSELWWRPSGAWSRLPLAPTGSQATQTGILERWSCVVGAVVSLLAAGASLRDPGGPWWACGTTALVAVAAGAAAARLRRPSLAYASMVLLGAAVTYIWFGTVPFTTAAEVLKLAQWWVLALGLVAGFWLAVEFAVVLRHGPLFVPISVLPPHRCFAAAALTGLLATTVPPMAIGTLQPAFGGLAAMDPSSWWGWAAAAAVGLVFCGFLWDRRARSSLLGIYVWSIAAQLLIIDVCQLRPDRVVVAVAISLAAHVCVTGLMWRRGANLAVLARHIGIPDPVAKLRHTAGWLPALNLLVGGWALFLGLALVLAHPERPPRVLAAAVPALLAIGMGCLAQSARKATFQCLALTMVGVSCTFLSWADIQPGWGGLGWLSRVIRLLMVCCLVSAVYTGIVARRRDLPPDWQMALKRVGLGAGLGALAVLAGVLSIEALLYFENPARGAPISDTQLAAVSVVMVGLVAALIGMAVLPGRDPLGLSEAGRRAYVYAAQLGGVLLFAHIALTRPEWFGRWGEFWPYIVLAIAFAGAGVGEVFQRTGHVVLAEPLQRTGTFLPLLPALGMWFVGSRSDYSLLLFGAGLLYGGLAIGRRSMAAGFAAGVAANGALWSLWYDRGFDLLGQPQLWLIPPAFSVLLASECNRRRIPPGTLTGLRYASTTVIYLSSVGEIFLRGIGEALWPPMVLLGLSLAGAMLGIVMKVRAFLFLGVTFMVLAMISMVWHAARSIDHVWPWWAFGIGLGVCILAFFGYFEKNRAKISASVERLKRWQP